MPTYVYACQTRVEGVNGPTNRRNHHAHRQSCTFWQTMMGELRAHLRERADFEARLRRIETEFGLAQGFLDRTSFVCCLSVIMGIASTHVYCVVRMQARRATRATTSTTSARTGAGGGGNGGAGGARIGRSFGRATSVSSARCAAPPRYVQGGVTVINETSCVRAPCIHVAGATHAHLLIE